MRFDKKKAAAIIAGGHEYKKTDDGDGFEQITADAMSLAMDQFIDAVHAKDSGKATKALKAWCQLKQAYGAFKKPVAEMTVKAGGSNATG